MVFFSFQFHIQNYIINKTAITPYHQLFMSGYGYHNMDHATLRGPHLPMLEVPPFLHPTYSGVSSS